MATIATAAAAAAAAKKVILHVGLGSFHRAHQAVYLNELIKKGDTSWTLVGGNIRGDMQETIDALVASDGAYTLETISPVGEHKYETITAISRVIPYTADLSALIAQGAHTDTKIISFTVTEAGYYLDAANKLDWAAFADLRADAETMTKATGAEVGNPTIYGALMAILRQRMAAGAGPVTLQCCDNLRHNGDRSRSGLLQFIERCEDPTLLAWVQEHTTSPNAMVDRITPRPTAAVVARVKAATGKEDAAALMGESFIQWVVEDRFAAGRPAWEQAGAQLVDSVDAYEEAKIRLLNATHSCVAWAGSLCGYKYIHECVQNADIRQIAYDYVTHDTIPVLEPCPLDLPLYRDTVLDRFGNEAICDTNQRVVMDGFSKLPGFIAPTIRERLARSEGIDSVAMLPALFLAFLQTWHSGKVSYTYQDAAMDPAVGHAICAAEDPVAALCADASLWGEIACDARLVAAVRGARERVDELVAKHHE